MDDLEEGDFRRHNPRFTEDNLARNLQLVDRVTALARERGITAGQLALAWVMAQGDDVVAIPGTKRRRWLEENGAAAQVELSEGDLAELDEALPSDAVSGDRYADMRFVGG